MANHLEPQNHGPELEHKFPITHDEIWAFKYYTNYGYRYELDDNATAVMDARIVRMRMAIQSSWTPTEERARAGSGRNPIVEASAYHSVLRSHAGAVLHNPAETPALAPYYKGNRSANTSH